MVRPLTRPTPGAIMTDIEALYREHGPALRRFAYRRTDDPDSAADLVQEAFARYAIAMRRQGYADAIRQPHQFLQRMIANMVVDTFRRHGRRGRTVALDTVGEDLPDPAVAIDRALAGREALDLLETILRDLPDRQREALILNRVHGLTHAQIAERMRVSPSMVSKYIMSALRTCHARLPAHDR